MAAEVRLTFIAATVDRRSLDRSSSARSWATTLVMLDTKVLIPSTCTNVYAYGNQVRKKSYGINLCPMIRYSNLC